MSSNASVECTLVFEDVNDTPDRLIYAGAEDEVVTNFTPVECEKCGETRCIDLQTSSVHCGQCDNEISYVEECENGVPTCEIGFRHEQGLCIPDVTNVSLKPASSTASCEEVCGESAYCEGVMATSACELAYDPVYPGSNNCRVSGAEMVYLADADPKCVLSTLFCACWTSSN